MVQQVNTLTFSVQRPGRPGGCPAACSSSCARRAGANFCEQQRGGAMRGERERRNQREQEWREQQKRRECWRAAHDGREQAGVRVHDRAMGLTHQLDAERGGQQS
jgi:hypothetical protein